MKLITDRWYSVVMPILQFLMGAGQFFILWYMGRGILRGDMTLGYMQQISSYITMLYSPLFLVLELFAQARKCFRLGRQDI